jgi:type II secretory pathway pseudopilin PulG
MITLGIIGIVAALTIPTLLNQAFEREAVSKAKETYSLLTQAVQSWQTDEGCLGDTAACPGIYPGTYPPTYPHQAGNIAQKIATYMKVLDGIYAPSCAQIASKDWIPSYAYALNGSQPHPYDTLQPILGKDDGSQGDCGWGAYMLLANGTVLKIDGIGFHYDFVFDINGPKGPNRFGKDQFAGSLYDNYRKSINPYYYATWGGGIGVCDTSWSSTCNADDGYSPLAYILKHDKLPDLKAMGFPTSP